MSDREAKEAREAERGYNDSSLREVRLRDWFSGRDDPRKDPAFAALVNRLRALKWRREVRAEGGDRLEQLRRRNRTWMASRKPDHDARRRAEAIKSAEVVTCACGVQWCNVPTSAGRPRRWCSLACQKRGIARAGKAGVVLACKVCGVQFCRVPWAAGQLNHCSGDCRQAGRQACKDARRRGR